MRDPAQHPDDARDLDLVLVGATGFVGRLTAGHLARSAPPGLRVALAGRSRDRLARLRAELPGPGTDWPLVSVDVTDPAAVAALASRTRVVLSTVGPYARYGLPLVRACAATGTHYADLTAEVLFVHATVTELHGTAAATGARLVHSCGFDSVPSDLGVLLTAEAARRDGAGELTDTVLHLRSVRAGISGGTIDSLRVQLAAARREPAARRVLADPVSLSGPAEGTDREGRGDAGGATRAARRGRRSRPVARDPATGRWQAPFVMAPYNTRLVRRSHALRGYGPRFRYAEAVDTGRGARGLARAVGYTAGIGALVGALAWAPTRALADRALPAPGEGPDERSRAAGHFTVEVVAATASGARYATTVAAPYDPGYDGTAVMLGESGLALVAGEGSDLSGVLTPATALGDHLAERLRRHGFTLHTRRLTG